MGCLEVHTGRRHGEVALNLEATCRWAHDTTTDLVTEARKLGCSASKPLEPAKWSPPPVDVVKVNMDAAFDQNSLAVATGMVIRDHRHCFIAAKAKKV